MVVETSAGSVHTFPGGHNLDVLFRMTIPSYELLHMYLDGSHDIG